MTPEQFQRVGELYDAAMEHAPEARSGFLAKACAGERELRREVESLLRAHEQANGFIAANVAPVVARMAARHKHPSLIGRSLGHYQALSLLGTGGMGEVYLAQDTRLGRKVALKMLPPAFARDEERLRRFKQEALAASTLNHPNILTVYDIGEASAELGGAPFIVAELLEGAELRKQMSEGPLPVRRAVEYARQIAAGLTAAHEKGVVHRDLKPENLFVTKDGLVKILDFGLAKLKPQRDAGSSRPDKATQDQITAPGTVMGTAAYMSPEQVRGQETDHRSDIFSFGLILYEMLAGQRAFQGESSAETMAAIVNQEPPELMEANPKILPQLERIVSRCLEKQPGRRFQTASDLGFALEALLTPSGSRLKEEPASSAENVVAAARRWFGREKLLIAATALVAAFFAWPYFTHPSESAPPLLKLSLSLPENKIFQHIAVSPDGKWLAFNIEADDKVQLWMLALSTGETRPLEGSQGARYPFWSPDSRFIAFHAANKLKKIDITGGLPITLCDFQGGNGGTWNRDGVILISDLGEQGLSRVPATGGAVTPVLQPGLARPLMNYRYPSFLPDGRHFICTVSNGDKETSGIYLGSLDGSLPQRLLDDNSNAIYASGPSGGYLLFGREGALMAHAFDEKALRLSGQPFPVTEQVAVNLGTILRRFSASDNGVLVFDPAPNRQLQQWRWVDRSGRKIDSFKPLNMGTGARIAPDGQRVVVNRLTLQVESDDLWLWDSIRDTETRLTFDPARDSNAVWSPDSNRIAWGSRRGRYYQIYDKDISQPQQETSLLQSDDNKFPTDWSHDGRYIIYRQSDPWGKFDLWALPLFGERKPFPLLQTKANEGGGALSPDGQWLAYHSDESGQYEIYLQNFSDGGSKQVISTAGGVWPQWRGDGKELFYHSPDGHLMSAPLTRGGTNLVVGAPIALLELRRSISPNSSAYSADRDGRRFLLFTTVQGETNSPLTALVNWTTGLKK